MVQFSLYECQEAVVQALHGFLAAGLPKCHLIIELPHAFGLFKIVVKAI